MAKSGRPRKHDPVADAIRQAITYGPFEEVERLVLSADVDVLDGEARTPLIHAVHCRSHELVVWLLQRGANPNHQDRSGSTALCRAAYAADVEGVECLLRHGADPNLRDKHGNGPLWEALCGAATDHQLRVLELLLQSGAQPDAVNIHGVSPRMRAQGHPQAAQALTDPPPAVDPPDDVGPAIGN